MADDFSIEVDKELKEFSDNALNNISSMFPLKIVEAAQELQSELILSTSETLKKYSQGTLKRAWKISAARTSPSGLEIDVTNAVPYALIHEEGGVIRPKRVKALAVPNRNYRPIIKNGIPIAPREFDPGRNLLKFQPPKKAGRIGYLVDIKTGELAYTLMASVKIKPTGYIKKALDRAAPRITELLGEGMVTALGKGA